ncbi:glutamate ABC transporter substrate-binding protein [Streptomyces sp. 4N509B]|uniref:glutamate ABC transporter substrate-binding protein n=1 Tax=Streptomyces sp. 4N509B TaxID=3457413 RepID=UPI003FD0B75C
MRIRKAGALAAAVLALSLAATACGSDDDGGDGGGGNGGSGGGGAEELRIGIKFDQPGLGLQEPGGGYSGFDVDVATFIAGEMGVEPENIEWVEAPSPDRESMLQRGDVDFIVASYSISTERQDLVSFAGPYFLAHQDLLVRTDQEVSEDAINDMTLCSVTGSTSAQNVVDSIAPDADLQEYNTYSECLPAVQNGTLDALTTDDSILAGYAAQDQYEGQFKLAGFSLSDEYYGVGVAKDDEALVEEINTALQTMIDEGAWEEAVEANFGPANYEYEQPPTIGDFSFLEEE